MLVFFLSCAVLVLGVFWLSACKLCAKHTRTIASLTWTNEVLTAERDELRIQAARLSLAVAELRAARAQRAVIEQKLDESFACFGWTNDGERMRKYAGL